MGEEEEAMLWDDVALEARKAAWEPAEGGGAGPAATPAAAAVAGGSAGAGPGRAGQAPRPGDKQPRPSAAGQRGAVRSRPGADEQGWARPPALGGAPGGAQPVIRLLLGKVQAGVQSWK